MWRATASLIGFCSALASAGVMIAAGFDGERLLHRRERAADRALAVEGHHLPAERLGAFLYALAPEDVRRVGLGRATHRRW